MNSKNRFFVFLILIFTSCNFLKLDKSLVPDNEDNPLFNSKFSFSDSNKVAYFECEDFASDALDKYSIATINKKFLNTLHCSREPVVNKYDSAVVDTIYTFSNAENKIQIYRAGQNDFIVTFDTTDSIFKLKGNIQPGMTKDVFCHKFHITEAIDNEVQIANSEGSMRFMFYFEDNRLKRINSYLYLD